MAADFRLKLNRQVTAQVRRRAAAGLLEGAEYVLERSQREVPIDDGQDLLRSGEASVDPDRLIAAVAYGTSGLPVAYAERQHEDLGYDHDPGRKAKFLEDPLNASGHAVGQIVAEEIRRGLHS